MRPVVSITCSGIWFSHGNFPVEFFPVEFFSWNFLVEISVLVGSGSLSHEESLVKELLVHHHLNGSEVIKGL